MKFSFEKPRGNEPDIEVVWLMVLAAAGIAALVWLTFPAPLPACPFHAFTGFPCPTCGGTRCIRNLLAGHFSTAVAWNPLVFLLAFAAAAYGLYASVTVVFRLPRVRLREISRGEGAALRTGVFLLLAVNWIYLIHHFSQLPPEATRKHGLTTSWVAQ